MDLDDDSKRRFVVRRYAVDPLRRERRQVVGAVVDNRREYERLVQHYSEVLRADQDR